MSNHYDYTQGFRTRAQVSLKDPALRRNLAIANDNQMSKRLHAMTSLKDSEALRDIAAEVRDAVLSQLDVHLDRLASNWERNGGRVFFAADASEATDYVLDIVKRVEAKLVVKSKSMASEEIRLNDTLIEQGIEPVETDLGEFIIQLAGEHPSHIITPAIHRSKEDVAALFGPLAGRVLPAETGPLAAFARAHLRKQFLRADIGINGVNFGIADEGALCLVTNEGNGRMCNSLPRVHIAIMGMERVVADWDQLAVMLSLLARSATGQKLTQYTSITFGPRPSSEYDGPDESHLIILDNGRSRALGTDQQSILRCIRCGACLNVCPVYRQVGGHAYDPVYSGPIGAVLNPILREDATELAHASSLCGACTEVCPVRIPLHDLLIGLRSKHESQSSGVERLGYKSWALVWTHGTLYRPIRLIGRLLARRSARRPMKRLPLPFLSRWTKSRRFTGPSDRRDRGSK